MRWYVVTERKLILGRFPTKRSAIRYALHRLQQKPRDRLYVIKEEDYNNNRENNILRVEPDVENIDKLTDLYEYISDWLVWTWWS